jgi:hypothetical protein
MPDFQRNKYQSINMFLPISKQSDFKLKRILIINNMRIKSLRVQYLDLIIENDNFMDMNNIVWSQRGDHIGFENWNIKWS